MQVAALMFAMTPRPATLTVDDSAQHADAAGATGDAGRVASQAALQPTGAPQELRVDDATFTVVDVEPTIP